MALELKGYQSKALDALSRFLELARGATSQAQVELAFATARTEALGEAVPAIAYRPLSREYPAIAQACIRIPTGGGKTLMAAHAIEIAARQYVGTRAPLALWLVPSDAIRTQTLDALRKPGHPYREALLQHYPADRLAVIDIADCEQLRAQDFGGRAIVAVGTIQTLRVGRTASRDVYAYKEAFEPHFAGIFEGEYLERIGDEDLTQQPYLKPTDKGKVKRSFANLLAHYRPIVILDEAHNAQTDLSFEVFRRIRPACVIEWTATPARDQNVLYHVSAQELKAEHMVKLPILLAPHPNWKEAVRDAVLARERLAGLAVKESDYVRPLVLLQADAKDGEVPVDALCEWLQTELNIERRRIAIATGGQRELDGVDLFDRACLVDFVITVEALKEGWDCSFAYVFCTVQNIRSAKDMEQLLGRVLRMPYARRRAAEELNRAYAQVCSPVSATVANQLADRLVAMGFEELEAVQAVQPPLDGDLFAPPRPQPLIVETPVELSAPVAAAITALAPEAVVRVGAGEGAGVLLRGVIPEAALEAALAAAPRKERQEVERALTRHQVRAQAAAAPAQRGEPFGRVPMLCVAVQGALTLLDRDLVGELAGFSLAGQACDLPNYGGATDEKPYLIDVDRGHLRIRQDEGQFGLDLDLGAEGVRREDVIRELDRRVRRDDLLQADMVAWLGRMLDELERRNFPLTHVARHLNQVADAAAKRVQLLAASAQRAAFQQALFGDRQTAALSEHYEFSYDPAFYPARWSYAGRHVFRKHYYALPGELKPEHDREETACAIEIDQLEAVKYWVRNLEGQPQHSFWLPTSTDRFYPDFVAVLNDGRMLVIEYKGGDRYTNADSREKRDIGSVWARASGGRCLFAMVTDEATAGKPVREQLRAEID